MPPTKHLERYKLCPTPADASDAAIASQTARHQLTQSKFPHFEATPQDHEPSIEHAFDSWKSLPNGVYREEGKTNPAPIVFIQSRSNLIS
jgi:hypothetical protein